MFEQFSFTTNRMNWLPVVCLVLAICIIDAEAQDSGEWVSAQITRSLPGQEDISGKTYFSKKFTIKEGTFVATYKSVLDKREKVSGNFIVGTFRYVYDKPMGEQDSDICPLHNEYITTIMLDCKNAFVGTIQSEYILNGRKYKL